jgi:hypothetical protein
MTTLQIDFLPSLLIAIRTARTIKRLRNLPVDAIADTVGGEVATKLIAKVTQQDFLMDHGRLA